MCGIAGIFSYHHDAPNVNRDELFRMQEYMHKRGPDGSGFHISNNQKLGFVHRRLSIIDLSDAGIQPMYDVVTGNYIIFNGEIYNFLQLKNDLKKSGHVFRTNSDTEVLLKLYAVYGEEMLLKLRGMYAFAIYDERRQGIFLARDPFGIKPLYIADDGKTIRFASQVKAILAGNSIDTTPESAGHVGFFLWGHIPDPFTLYKGIRALPAGTSQWIDNNGCKAQKTFFCLVQEINNTINQRQYINYDEAREQLRIALFNSVKYHLVSDVPVGIFLSSGIDSTTLVGLASEIMVEKSTIEGVFSSDQIRTITLGFEEFINTENDEVPLAERIAEKYKTLHTTRVFEKEDFSYHYSKIMSAMDQPSIDGINTYFVSLAAKQAGLKVALSGLGGDELFAGYSDFQDIPRLVKILGPFSRIPCIGLGVRYLTKPFLTRCSPKYASLLEYGGEYHSAYLLRRGLFMPWELTKLLDREIVEDGLNKLQVLPTLRDSIKGITNSQLKISALEMGWYMQNQLLRDTDWASMANSIEVRVPFVDLDLFRTVISFNFAGYNLNKKDMAFAPYKNIPNEVINRKKSGFSVPMHKWMVEQSKLSIQLSKGSRRWALEIYSKF